MKSKTIVFTKPQTAEFLEWEIRNMEGDLVKIKMEYTVVSGGTERAGIMGVQNTFQQYPMCLGYCGVGYVTEIGDAVKKVQIGDRVLVYHGIHTQYNVVPKVMLPKLKTVA